MHVWARGIRDMDLFELSKEPVLFPEQFAPLLEELQDLRDGDTDSSDQMNSLSSQLTDAENEIDEMRAEIGSLEKQVSTLETELAEARIDDA